MFLCIIFILARRSVAVLLGHQFSHNYGTFSFQIYRILGSFSIRSGFRKGFTSLRTTVAKGPTAFRTPTSAFNSLRIISANIASSPVVVLAALMAMWPLLVPVIDHEKYP